MGTLESLAAFLFLVVIIPLFVILHFVTKWKQAREISSDDEQLLEDLWQLSQRLEDRLETLERILDDELSNWRKKE